MYVHPIFRWEIVKEASELEKLTFAMGNYLEAVYELSLATGGARVSDIAQRLQVSKASVNNAMNVLAAKGLVKNERYRSIRLTETGRHLARSTSEKHQILQTLLVQVMGVNPAIADEDACAIEHVISTESAEHILTFLEEQGIMRPAPGQPENPQGEEETPPDGAKSE